MADVNGVQKTLEATQKIRNSTEDPRIFSSAETEIHAS